MQAAFKQEGALVKLVAPMVGGVEASDGSWIDADEKIDGGPSVVFDAVAVLLSDAGAALLAEEATARDFVADAFAHCKFIAHTAAAMPLLQKAGVGTRRRRRRTESRGRCRRLRQDLRSTPLLGSRSEGEAGLIRRQKSVGK